MSREEFVSLMPKVMDLIRIPKGGDREGMQTRTTRVPRRYYKLHGRGHNHDTCDLCNGGGELICCDSCSASFHLVCCFPPLEDEQIPAGEWRCQKCTVHKLNKGKKNTKKGASKKNKKDEVQTFKVEQALMKYMETLEATNSTAFSVDKDKTDLIPMPGDDKALTKGRKRKKLLNEKRRGPNDRAKCFWCDNLELCNKMMKCNFCNLFFHRDCFDVPYTFIYGKETQWICPLHMETYLDERINVDARVSQRLVLRERFGGAINVDEIADKLYRKIEKPDFFAQLRLRGLEVDNSSSMQQMRPIETTVVDAYRNSNKKPGKSSLTLLIDAAQIVENKREASKVLKDVELVDDARIVEAANMLLDLAEIHQSEDRRSQENGESEEKIIKNRIEEVDLSELHDENISDLVNDDNYTVVLVKTVDEQSPDTKMTSDLIIIVKIVGDDIAAVDAQRHDESSPLVTTLQNLDLGPESKKRKEADLKARKTPSNPPPRPSKGGVRPEAKPSPSGDPRDKIHSKNGDTLKSTPVTSRVPSATRPSKRVLSPNARISTSGVPPPKKPSTSGVPPFKGHQTIMAPPAKGHPKRAKTHSANGVPPTEGHPKRAKIHSASGVPPAEGHPKRAKIHSTSEVQPAERHPKRGKIHSASGVPPAEGHSTSGISPSLYSTRKRKELEIDIQTLYYIRSALKDVAARMQINDDQHHKFTELLDRVFKSYNYCELKKEMKVALSMKKIPRDWTDEKIEDLIRFKNKMVVFFQSCLNAYRFFCTELYFTRRLHSVQRVLQSMLEMNIALHAALNTTQQAEAVPHPNLRAIRKRTHDFMERGSTRRNITELFRMECTIELDE